VGAVVLDEAEAAPRLEHEDIGVGPHQVERYLRSCARGQPEVAVATSPVAPAPNAMQAVGPAHARAV
jgi:hypothetical protein